MSPKTEAKRICKAIKQAGGEAWYVGGYVRDRLLQTDEYLEIKRPDVVPKDIDLEVFGIDAETLPEILREAGVNAKKVGRQFPVWTTENGIDISLPREERGDGVHHNTYEWLSFSPDLPVDKAMQRRDFTINTFMRCGAGDGRLVYCKGALDDLRHGIIRHQNNKFAEDPLRVFRAARFAAKLGFELAPETDELCRTIDTRELSKERVAEETKLALMTDKPSRYFMVMKDWEAFRIWFPELALCVGEMQPKKYHPEGDVFTHTMLALDYAAEHRMPFITRLAVLCHDLGKPLTRNCRDGEIKFHGHARAGAQVGHELLQRLCISNRTQEPILKAVEHHMDIYELEKGAASYKTYNKLFDKVDACLLIELTECDRFGTTVPLAEKETGLKYSRAAFSHYFDRLRWERNEEISARDLIVMGWHPSSAFSPALDLAHKLWLSEVPKKEAVPMVLSELRKAERRLTKTWRKHIL